MEGQTIICPNCQTTNPARNLFCQACGKPLAAQAAPVPPPGYPPQPVYPPAQPAAPSYPQASGYPPQQPAYYPPPPAPNLNLGTRLDGWVSVVEGAAEKAGDVEAAFVEEFQKWEVPQANLQHADLPVAGQRRGYQMVNSYHGLHIVGVNPIGKNLQVTWNYYKRLELNWPMIGIVIGIAFGFALLSALFSMIQFAAAGFFFSSWLTGGLSYLVLSILACGVYGLVYKGSIFAMFIKQPDALSAQEAATFSSMVHQSLVSAVEKSVKGAKLPPKSHFRSIL